MSLRSYVYMLESFPPIEANNNQNSTHLKLGGIHSAIINAVYITDTFVIKKKKKKIRLYVEISTGLEFFWK